MPVITKIKLTGENHQDVDMVCSQIKAICDETGVDLRGPIPLPTRRLVVPCRKSPDGEGAETWDHWEMRVHKRLLELVTSAAKDEKSSSPRPSNRLSRLRDHRTVTTTSWMI
uniref:Small ribosomal subunit protein uS10 n=1 Tax=uncultured marine group II/III euryarchaeote AD1000_32_G05 TaxID=1457755 RepID=A0A075FPQ2_9EURY|nr:ribosomal protein S10P (RP-S10, rpsJ) [uncultured marine group II/III euryarchaeote AD1000_32_G05]